MKLALACALAVLGCSAPAPQPRGRKPDPSAFRFETVLFEIPLATAERLHRPADEREPTVAIGVDETGSREILEGLVRTDPAIRRGARPDLVVAPDASGFVPDPPTPGGAGLEIRLRATTTVREWAPVRIEVGLRWLRPDGGEIASVPRSSFLLAEDRSVRLVCLPPRADAGELPAVFGFVRVTPVFGGGNVADPRPGGDKR